MEPKIDYASILVTAGWYNAGSCCGGRIRFKNIDKPDREIKVNPGQNNFSAYKDEYCVKADNLYNLAEYLKKV